MNRAQRVQAVIWLEQLAAAAERHAATIRAELAADARAELAEQGTAPSWRISEVATVSGRVAAAKVTISDPKAFASWVAERHPTEIEPPVPLVRPAFARKVLKAAKPGGTGVVDDQGELIPGLDYLPGGELTGIAIAATDTAKEVFGGVAEEGLRFAATLTPPDWAGQLVDLLDLGPAAALAAGEPVGHLEPGEVG
ncbi:hypothetical protein GCM10018962_77520 [Dactylosporangium matsuzakiense]|uniref:hypothetical protein n=1 Tax=Dactylosporangium matsuzakiense TaxID=53360 RepID=UPI0031EFC54F